MSGNTQLLQALVYRNADDSDSDITCYGCAESLATLLQNTPSHHINITYVGPRDLPMSTPNLFKNAAIFAIPGGNSLNKAWKALKPQNDEVRAFVAGGGRFIGVCLGAFLAGPDHGFNLLDAGNTIVEEIYEPKNPVGYGNFSDAVADVAWTYQTGVNQSRTYDQYAFFQDGPAFIVPNKTHTRIVSHYVSNGNISATINSFGKGYVGLVGVHIDADATWYVPPATPHKFTNPSGVQFDIGYDLINATLNGANPDSTFVHNVPYTPYTGQSYMIEARAEEVAQEFAVAASSSSSSAAVETSAVSLVLLLVTGFVWMRNLIA